MVYIKVPQSLGRGPLLGHNLFRTDHVSSGQACIGRSICESGVHAPMLKQMERDMLTRAPDARMEPSLSPHRSAKPERLGISGLDYGCCTITAAELPVALLRPIDY